MAEVPYGPVMKPSTDAPPKRVLGDDITNKDTTTSPPKRQKTAPKKKVRGPYVLKWTDADRHNSKPHSDATKEGAAVVRTYGLPLTLQARHSPDIASSTVFYALEAPNAAKAAKARKSGEMAKFVPTSEQPLEQPPINGGVSHKSSAFEISPDVVGVNEGKAASAALGNKVKARKKQARGNGSKVKGVARAPSFRVWFDGELVGKYEGALPKVAPDIKQKRPGEYMSQEMLSCLLGKNKQKLMRRLPSLEKKLKETKFTAEWD
jgi:hypothetical protein